MTKRTVVPFDGEAAKRAVVTVGDGRGFVMEMPPASHMKGYTAMCRIVVTAAHCLPHLPPTMSFALSREKTYTGLLGPLGTSKPSIMAECLFVDPVADIAVLGEPDGQTSQAFYDASLAFEKFIQKRAALSLSTSNIVKPMTGWLLSLDGHWSKCTITASRSLLPPPRALWATEAIAGIFGGMSGSPILLDDGRVIGVFCTAIGESDKVPTGGGPQPRLTHHLPWWLVKRLREKR